MKRRVAQVAGAALASYRAVRARQHALETHTARRFPGLYDARHAAAGLGQVLWLLIGSVLLTAILFPVVVLAAWLVALLDLHLPAIHLPSVNLPDIPVPSIAAPGWLRAIGDVLGAVLALLRPVLKYTFPLLAAVLGIRRTLAVRRLRREAEQIGRAALLRRLAVLLGQVERLGQDARAERVGDVPASVESTDVAQRHRTAGLRPRRIDRPRQRGPRPWARGADLRHQRRAL